MWCSNACDRHFRPTEPVLCENRKKIYIQEQLPLRIADVGHVHFCCAGGNISSIIIISMFFCVHHTIKKEKTPLYTTPPAPHPSYAKRISLSEIQDRIKKIFVTLTKSVLLYDQIVYANNNFKILEDETTLRYYLFYKIIIQTNRILVHHTRRYLLIDSIF